jgi:hypothetical protein
MMIAPLHALGYNQDVRKGCRGPICPCHTFKSSWILVIGPESVPGTFEVEPVMHAISLGG